MRSRIRVALLGTVFMVAIVLAMAWRIAHWHGIGWTGIRFAPTVSTKTSLPPLFRFFSPSSGEVQLVLPGTPAARAGMHKGDIVESVNGIPIERVSALRELRDRTRRGDIIEYEVRRSDGVHRIQARTASPLTIPSVVVTLLTSLVVATAFVAIAVLVYWNRPRSRTAWVFFWLCINGGLVFGNAAVIDLEVSTMDGIEPFMTRTAGLILFLVSALMTTAMTGLLLHFALIFPKELPIVRRIPSIVQWVHGTLYLPLMIIGGTVLIGAASRSFGGKWIAAAIAAGLAAGWVVRLTMRGLLRWRALIDHPFSALLLVVLAGMLMILGSRPLWEHLGPGVVGAVFGLSVVLIYFGIYVAYAIFTVAALYKGYRLSTIEEKRQVRWPLWGTIVGLGLAIGGQAVALFAASGSRHMPALMIAGSAVSLLSYLILPLSFAFAILKHRLMDIDIIIRKTLVYSVVTSVIVGAFFVLVAGLGTIVTKTLEIESQTVTVFSTLMLAAVFLPLRNRVQRFVDRRFFRRKYESADAEKLIGQEILRATELRPLLEKVCETVQQALQVRSVAILCAENSDDQFAIRAAIGVPDSLLALVLERETLRNTSSVTAVSALRLQDDERQMLRRMHADLAAPLARRGQLRGIMLLGSRLSGEWEEDDHIFIAAVSEQIALGIENLSVGDEVREYERALQIQRALLPASMPRIEGVDVDAMWKPARTVSGDYFDVIPIDNTLAFCIGDVAGKGMPAALLMANLQAAVKASLRDNHSPSEICARVSAVVCSTLQSGAFVTFFLGLLDTATMTLRYTNAGHNPPVLLKRDGEVIRLSEGGPAFARLMRNGSYVTREVALERGDVVFLFTDGVTEARNPEEEEFGEERMLAALRAASGPSNTIVRDLVEQVRDFSHGVVFDDITVVCLRVTGPTVSNVVPFARAT